MKPILKLSLAIFLLYIVKIFIDCYMIQKVLPELEPEVLGASRFDKSDRLLVQINKFKNKFKGEMNDKKYRNIIRRQVSRIERLSKRKNF